MAKFTSHKGSWGDRYTIQQPKNKETITCAECVYYCSDGSCGKHPIVIAEVGYNYWRYCKDFILEQDSITDKRYDYIMRTRGDSAIERRYNPSKIVDHSTMKPKKQAIDQKNQTDGKSNKAQFGDEVLVERLENRTRHWYNVETSPFSDRPPAIIGGCLNKKVGDTFSIGGVTYKIIEIKKGKPKGK